MESKTAGFEKKLDSKQVGFETVGFEKMALGKVGFEKSWIRKQLGSKTVGFERVGFELSFRSSQVESS